MEIPKYIKDLLKTEQLCTMATCLENKPYLSLMNFTYVEAENKIILSSRKNSKKYHNIQENKNISLLVFSSSNKQSATFLGTAKTMETKNENYYSKMHKENIKMPQFVLGDNMALIIFKIEEIIISNSQDQVDYIKGVD